MHPLDLTQQATSFGPVLYPTRITDASILVRANYLLCANDVSTTMARDVGYFDQNFRLTDAQSIFHSQSSRKMAKTAKVKKSIKCSFPDTHPFRADYS